ncbi:MAG: ABC transporter substrate-binding protein [Thermomicrobiales bacterium]|nr:ABC transporter substrate-binding protein [Thermomicrobiales bacterium]
MGRNDRLVTRRRVVQGIAALGLGASERAARTLAQATPPAATPVNGGFPVTLSHAQGETTIPARPERIVTTTDFADLDFLLTLGVEPVLYGFSNSWESGPMPWQAGAEDLPHIDFTGELDFEAIVAAQPDVIITTPQYVEDWYERLSAIAPTIALDWNTPWRDGLRLVARAVGEEERAEQEIAATGALLAAAQADLAPAAARPLMVGFQYDDVAYIWGPQSPGGAFFQDLGLTFVGGDDPIIQQISLEQFTLLTPAEMLLSVASDPPAIAAQEANPLFLTLPAVKRRGYGVLSVLQSRAIADEINPLSIAWVLPDLVSLLLELAAGDGSALA